MKRLRAFFGGVLLLVLLQVPAFAAEQGQPDITPQMTMAEIRANPSIQGSGISTYGIGDADCAYWRRKSDASTLEQQVGHIAAPDCAEGLNLAIRNYNAGIQVTWQVYSPEEIAADSSLGTVQLYYYPADVPNARYALVLGGNALRWTGELSEGIASAAQLHEQGYAVFVLRYSTWTNLYDNRPLTDLGRAVQFITAHAGQFDVQAEDYALIGYSSGGHLCGLFSSAKDYGYKHYDVPKPGALILAYSVIDFAEVKPVYHLTMDPCTLDWRYYWTTVADAVTEEYPPVYFWYGAKDVWVLATGYYTQWPALQKALDAYGVPYKKVIYASVQHGSSTGRGTEADGWLVQAAAFWEKQTAGK